MTKIIRDPVDCDSVPSCGTHSKTTDMLDVGPMTTKSHVDAFWTTNPVRPNSIIGRGVIVHAAGEDDLTSQPMGDAGARVAFGVNAIAREWI